MNHVISGRGIPSAWQSNSTPSSSLTCLSPGGLFWRQYGSATRVHNTGEKSQSTGKTYTWKTFPFYVFFIFKQKRVFVVFVVFQQKTLANNSSYNKQYAAKTGFFDV